MFRIISISLTALIIFCLVSTYSYAAPTTQKTIDKQILIQGNNQFALDIYDKLREEKGNIFFSPYSISTALAMTYAGACGNTAKQMADVLHFDLENEQLHSAFAVFINELNAGGKKGTYQLSVANALWGQKGYSFLESYLDLVEQNYKGGLNEVDFLVNPGAARKTINSWVEKQTNNKIKDLVKPSHITRLTTLVLTNAIYFKGNWVSQFNKQHTQDEKFTLSDGKKVNIPMMHQTANFKYMAGDGFQALELPYVDNDLSMIVFLPNKADGLQRFERKMNSRNLAKWLSGLRKQEVDVALPRFKMISEFELAEKLESMGMVDSFDNADFSGMTGRKDLYISKVLHKAFVDVNEEGTEAAAATAVIMARGGPLVPSFRVDHPFLFLIRHVKSNSILFMGRVLDPSEK